MLFACGTEKTEDVEEDMNNAEVELVTREWIIAHFGFTEEELEGIDVDAVIQYRKYTEEYLKKDIFTKEYFLKCLKRNNKEIKTNVSYLFDGGQPDGKISVSQIKTIAFLEGEDNANYYWHISVQNKKAYYCFGYKYNIDLEKECDSSVELTDEYIAELLNCLEKANLHKWKSVYNGTNNNSTGDWRWDLGIELFDGTVYSWGGGGMFGDNKPEEFEPVKDVIEKSA